MEVGDFPQSLVALKLFDNTCECTFDLTLDGP